MHIVVVGVDHITASIELRERLACSTRQIPQVLMAVRQETQESVVLSTCNRLEIYAVCAEAEEGCSDLLRIISEARQMELEELKAHAYTLVDEQAVAHLFGVTCGLYSLVPGEPQIQGQVVDALEIAQGGGYAGPILSALFRAAVVTGKRARTETGISRNAASVSHVAVQLARHFFANLHEANILLIGSGTMSELAARNLRANGAERLVIVNRTLEHALNLAKELNAVHRPFTELCEAMIESDVVISSTRAPRAIITPELMAHVMEQRQGRSLLLIDIALPRDIDPLVADCEGVHLYNIDDLQQEVDHGISLRMQEIEHVQQIISEELTAFQRWQASLSVVSTINDLRQYAESLRRQELARTLRQLGPGLTEHEVAVVQEMSTRLINKLLHIPMKQLKEAAAAGQGHIYTEAMRYLFHLDEEEENYEANTHRDSSQQARHDADELGQRATTSAVARS
ncbi:MAG TPA: glutamyl-tRNA reductase [Ktedonobacteraceae bacterium]|jgi:glutamyl-tRNA reductase